MFSNRIKAFEFVGMCSEHSCSSRSPQALLRTFDEVPKSDHRNSRATQMSFKSSLLLHKSALLIDQCLNLAQHRVQKNLSISQRHYLESWLTVLIGLMCDSVRCVFLSVCVCARVCTSLSRTSVVLWVLVRTCLCVCMLCTRLIPACTLLGVIYAPQTSCLCMCLCDARVP